MVAPSSADTTTYKGQCFCGAVTIEVSGEPAGAGYCHCKNCRSWSAGPVNAFTLWKPEAVKVTQGEDQIGEYNENEQSYRQWCKACGGHCHGAPPAVGSDRRVRGDDPDFPFEPGVHVNYESTVLPMKDGLPEAEGLPRRARRLGRDDGRVAARGPAQRQLSMALAICAKSSAGCGSLESARRPSSTIAR